MLKKVEENKILAQPSDLGSIPKCKCVFLDQYPILSQNSLVSVQWFLFNAADKQTNKQTYGDENITSLEEVAMVHTPA